MSLLDKLDECRAALSPLADTPGKQSSEELRDFITGMLPILRTYRQNRNGFTKISRDLHERTGVKIAVSTLKRHYQALEKASPTSMVYSKAVIYEKPTLIVPPPQEEQQLAPMQKTAPADDGYGFLVGDTYELQNVEGERQICRTVQYDGFRDGKYVFLQTTQAGTVEKAISPAALKYYTVLRK